MCVGCVGVLCLCVFICEYCLCVVCVRFVFVVCVCLGGWCLWCVLYVCVDVFVWCVCGECA